MCCAVLCQQKSDNKKKILSFALDNNFPSLNMSGFDWQFSYVITVGASRPVNLGNWEISNAIWISGSSISLAKPSTLSFSYESMYSLQRKKIPKNYKTGVKCIQFLMFLPNGCTRATRSTESHYNSTSIFENDAQTLIKGNQTNNQLLFILTLINEALPFKAPQYGKQMLSA